MSAKDFASSLLAELRRLDPRAGSLLIRARAKTAVIGVEDEPLVSSDLRGRSESFIHASGETRVAEGGLVRVFGWYDNEWGFANRMLELGLRMDG